MYNPNAPVPYSSTPQQADVQDERRYRHPPADQCPECGADLTQMEGAQRYKHAIYHWGDAPLNNYPSTLEARKRKAMVLGTTIESVTM